MSDLISRQAVLDKFNGICKACGAFEKYSGVMCACCALDDGISIVEDAPSAEPEERTAKVEGSRCTACDNHIRPMIRYCDYCGARLEWE